MRRTVTIIAAITASVLIAGCTEGGKGCVCITDQGDVQVDAPASGVCQDLVQTNAQYHSCGSPDNSLSGPSDGLSFLKGPDLAEVVRKTTPSPRAMPTGPARR